MRILCPRRSRALSLMLAATLLAAAALPAHAQWKWRDKAGQITASDLPPPRDVAEKDILQRPDANARRAPAAAGPSAVAGATTAASAPGAAPAPAVDKDLEARKRAAEQEQQSRSKADDERQKAQRTDNCRRAGSQLTALESGQRMARMNDKGEREVIDDKTRADEMRRTREVIATDCK